MDYLPDGVVIADKHNINYINSEAWKILRCTTNDEEVEDISNVFCQDSDDCSYNTPVYQLTRYLSATDERFALIEKSKFLEHIYNTATPQGMLLQLNWDKINPCELDEDSEV